MKKTNNDDRELLKDIVNKGVDLTTNNNLTNPKPNISIKETKKEVKISKFVLTVNERTLASISDVVNCYDMLVYLEGGKKKLPVVCGCGGVTHLCSKHAEEMWKNQQRGVYNTNEPNILAIIDGRIWNVKNKRVGFKWGIGGVVLEGEPHALLVKWDNGTVTGLADVKDIVCIYN